MNNLMSLFIDGKVAVRVKTKQAYKSFLKLCEERDLKWCDGEKASEYNAFGEYEDLCLSYKTMGSIGLGYGYEEFYEKEGFQIVEYRG